MSSENIRQPLDKKILEQTLLEFILDKPVSVRLRNVITIAAQKSDPPFKTIGEYLRAGASAQDRIGELKNAGRKTAHEFNRLVYTNYENGFKGDHRFYREQKHTNITTQEPREENLLETPITEILKKYNPSFKLQNFFDGQLQIELPYQKLGEYLAKGENASEEIKCFKSVGNKTVAEIDSIINNFCEENGIDKHSILLNQKKDVAASRTDGISETILNKSILTLINSVQCSARLKNCIIKNFDHIDFPYKTIKDYIQCGVNAKNMILIFKNTGKKSALEIDRIITEYIESRNDENKDNEQGPRYISELIIYLLDELTKKEADIISLRYGLNNKGKETLEEIGIQFGVTRERIRQLESKAMKKLSLKCYKNQIKHLLNINREKIYKTLSDKYGIINNKNLQPLVREKLSGEHLLIIDIHSGNIEDWLNSIAIKIFDSWYLGPYSKEKIESCFEIVNRQLKKIASPSLVRTIKNQIKEDEHLIDICLSINAQYQVLDQIVFKKHVGRRKRRQAHLFTLLYDNSQTLGRLTATHNSRYQQERCSYRDTHIVISDAPHLFVSLGDEGWTTVGYLNETDLANVKSPSKTIELSDEDFLEDDLPEKDPHNLVTFVSQLLRETGPIHFVELRNIYLERSNNKYSPSSLGPILICNDGFVRLAPGVYGLTDNGGRINPFFMNTDILMQNTDCYHYVVSRWAGEAIDSFPLWSYELEYKWCRWAQVNANEELFSSLLEVCSPTMWQNCQEEEKTYWSNLKIKRGAYRFDGISRHCLHDKLPSLRDLYRILTSIKNKSDLNWIRINRILGKRIDDNHSASFLAILIALDILSPAQTWQISHLIKNHDVVLKNKLGKELTLQGVLLWNSPLGQELIVKLQEAVDLKNMGWVDLEELKQLTSRLAEDKLNLEELKTANTCEYTENEEESLDEFLDNHQKNDKDNEYLSLIESLL